MYSDLTGTMKGVKSTSERGFFPDFSSSISQIQEPLISSNISSFFISKHRKVFLCPMSKHGIFYRCGSLWDRIIWLFLRQRYSKDTENRDLLIHVVLFWWWWWDLDAEESFDLRFVPEEVVWPAPEHNGSISLTIFLTQSLLLKRNRVVQEVLPVKVFRPWLLLDILRPVIRALRQSKKWYYDSAFASSLQYPKLGGKGNLGGYENMQWSSCR